MKLRITRRHLLKGSLAAPLVMTVRSAAGTGMAMTSAGACKTYDKDRYSDGHVYKFRTGPNDDEWLRTPCEIHYLKKKNSNGTYSDISGEYFKGNTGCWWKYTKVGDDCQIEQKVDWTEPPYESRKVVRKEYALVCVDDNGVVKGYAWEKPSYNPITCSCWASLNT